MYYYILSQTIDFFQHAKMSFFQYIAPHTIELLLFSISYKFKILEEEYKLRKQGVLYDLKQK